MLKLRFVSAREAGERENRELFDYCYFYWNTNRKPLCGGERSQSTLAEPHLTDHDHCLGWCLLDIRKITMVCPFFIEKAVESASTSSWDQTPTGYSGNQNYRHYCTRIPGVLYSVRLHWSLGSSRSWCHRYALAWSRGLPKHVPIQRDQPYHLLLPS